MELLTRVLVRRDTEWLLADHLAGEDLQELKEVIFDILYLTCSEAAVPLATLQSCDHTRMSQVYLRNEPFVPKRRQFRARKVKPVRSHPAASPSSQPKSQAPQPLMASVSHCFKTARVFSLTAGQGC